MLQNYAAAALRNLARNPLYSLANLIGLAVGIAAAALIALYVRDEFNYEAFIPDYRNIYLVETTATPPEGHAPLEALPGQTIVASWLRLDVPAVAHVARIMPALLSFRRGEVEAMETLLWADPDLFSILKLPVFAGNLQDALARPDGLVLTRSTARKYFGRDDPVGETLELARQQRMTVTAVIEDLPSNTHLSVTAIASGTSQSSTLAAADRDPGWPWGAYTYVTLKPGFSPAATESRFLAPLYGRHSLPGSNNGKVYHLHLLPIGAIHFASGALTPLKPAQRRETVYSIAAVGALILAVATLNFVNLMTARANRRFVEVGVRKAAGARRRDLLVQFVGECLIYVGIASLMALSLAELLLPSMNGFLHRTIDFSYWSDPGFAAVAAASLVVLGVVAGIYPALVLSAAPPTRVFNNRGSVFSAAGSKVRQWLVTSQVAILMGLVVAAIVIDRQASFAMTQSLRMNSDQVLVIRSACPGAFKDALKGLHGVRAAACSRWAPPETLEAVVGITLPDGRTALLHFASIDFGFLELFGLQPLAGRFPAESYGTDVLSPEHRAVVINEAAVRAFGFQSPRAAIGGRLHWLGQWAQIIGVVPDFLTGSIREPIDPAAFYVDPPDNRNLSVKLDGQTLAETLAGIDALWNKMGNAPISRTFVDQLLQGKYDEFTRQATLLAISASVAVFIACLGLFALAAFTAERRSKEVAIRKALGADRAAVIRMLLWEFTQPVLWANVIAWPLSFFLMNRWLSGFAYHANLRLWMFVFAGGVATAITFLTVFAHTLFVASQKPVTALRQE
jgi:putative ABC transport system permease protein